MFYSLFTEPSTSLMLVLAGPRPAPGHGHQRNWVLAAGWSPAGTSTSPAMPRHISGASTPDFVTAEFLGTARRLLFHEVSTTPEITKMLDMMKRNVRETRGCTNDGTILFLLKNLHFHVRNSIIQGEEGFLLFKPLIIIWEMQLSFGFLFRFAYSQQWWQKYWTNLPRKVLKIIKNNPGTHDSTASIL